MQLTIYQGENKTLVYKLTDDVGDPVDLTLIDAEWRLASRTDETPIITKTVGAGITYTNAAGGILEVALSPEDTELLSGAYRRELRLTSGADYRKVPDHGLLKIEDSLFVAG